MPKAKKSWSERMKAKPPHVVVLDKDFAGVAKGARLLISNPEEIAEFLFTIPPGRSIPVQQLRRDLATHHKADAACPVSTSIFLRIVAEHVFEQAQAGVPVSQLPPVWRVIDSRSPLMKKLSFDTAWIRWLRDSEHLPP